jgi:hypothetical protein
MQGPQSESMAGMGSSLKSEILNRKAAKVAKEHKEVENNKRQNRQKAQPVF